MIIRGYKDNIIQRALRVAYDQTHDQTSISQGHKVSHTSTQSRSSTKNKRDKKQHSLSKTMIYTFFSPFGNKLPKSSKMHSAKRLSGLIFGRWCWENSKDEGFWWRSWSWWSSCWRWNWCCSCWCWCCSSSICHGHCSRSLSFGHSSKSICSRLALLFLHFLLKLLNCSLDLSYLDIKSIEFLLLLSKLSWFWVRVAKPFSILRVDWIRYPS